MISPQSQSPESHGLEHMQSVFMRAVYDPEFHSLMAADPREALSSKGLPSPPLGAEILVHVNTPDTFHIVFPADPNVALSDESLGMVAGGGKTAGTAGCASSASTLGCVCTTASSATTASTLATAGSAGS